INEHVVMISFHTYFFRSTAYTTINDKAINKTIPDINTLSPAEEVAARFSFTGRTLLCVTISCAANSTPSKSLLSLNAISLSFTSSKPDSTNTSGTTTTHPINKTNIITNIFFIFVAIFIGYVRHDSYAEYHHIY